MESDLKEKVLYEGFLTKSPPTKRIWRARWRRRWFALKQGELPGQFFMEYYTDRNCRKRKGVIDLDECEQVDAGLRMDKHKIKFQHMFDIKTPHRVYYLAADSDEEAKHWVNLICQVCNLQETDENGEPPVQYYNLCANGDITVEEQPSSSDEKSGRNDESNRTDSTTMTSLSSSVPATTVLNNSLNEYENDNVVSYRHMQNYSNRETVVCDTQLQQRKNAENVANNNSQGQESILAYSNLPPAIPPSSTSTIDRHFKQKTKTDESMHQRTQSLDQSGIKRITGAIKKIPENLKLRSTVNDDRLNNNSSDVTNTSASSGPYIPICECFTGSPISYPSEHSPATPLNSLDPKFYETPRAHINIGLNLTQEQLQYSPKRVNNTNPTSPPQSAEKSRDGRSSPSDSDVFTDDEFAAPQTTPNTLERNMRPSDSSIENDAVGFTIMYKQRFSKQPDGTQLAAPPRPPKRANITIDTADQSVKEPISSDVENVSPIDLIGPKENTSFVEESYDIPRSHQPQYYKLQSVLQDQDVMFTTSDSIVSSTPNLVQENGDSATLERADSKHFYTNAAPTKIEGNVFRYDFFDPPIVNRNLKPKLSTEKIPTNGYGMIRALPSPIAVGAPTVDRKLKPTIAAKPSMSTNSLHRKGPGSLSLSETDNLQHSLDESTYSNQKCGISPRTPDRLQYLDLDHTSSPQKPPAPATSIKSINSLASVMANLELSGTLTRTKEEGPSVAYTTVDFVKTSAFNRVREDSEATRNSKSRGKN